MSTVRFALASLLLPSAVVLAASACGAPPKAPDAPGAASSGATPAPAASGPAAEPTSPPTTTTQLDADAGLGTKLEPKRSSDGRGAADIDAAIKARKADTRACYDKVASKDPKIEGDVRVSWTIDPTGAVTNVAVDPAQTNVGDDAVGKCLVEVVKSLHFPASAKGFETPSGYKWNFRRNMEQFRAARDAGLIP